MRLFSVIPRLQILNLRNAGQFKDEVVNFIFERDIPLKSLQLEAANLISNEKWKEFFEKCGKRLESLKLSWLDFSMDDSAFISLVRHCRNLKRLKIKKCFRLGDTSIVAITELKQLEHLSLRFPSDTASGPLADLIPSIGPGLRTLSLESFNDANDEVLLKIHSSCAQLSKLRFTENDCCTDTGFVALFTGWSNAPLRVIDFSINRSLDQPAASAPENCVGLASAGFEALMDHSGSSLERLDISSCRHINYDSFSHVFDGVKQYPFLKDLNISFLTKVDNAIIASLFKSCPELVKVTAFGCFNVANVPIPSGVALIGIPNAQESILREGNFDADLW